MSRTLCVHCRRPVDPEWVESYDGFAAIIDWHHAWTICREVKDISNTESLAVAGGVCSWECFTTLSEKERRGENET